MAYYGIPSAGIALTAGSDNDQIGVIGHGATTLTAQTIFGGAGNDIINFGAAGFTATLTANVSGGGSGAIKAGLSAVVADPNSIFDSQTVLQTAVGSGGGQGSATITLTSVAAIATIDSAFIQANAGNDTIALGTSLTRVTATQLKAGAGNDFIGFGTQLRAAGSFSTATQSGAAFKASTIVGGAGNDTIKLDNDNTFTGVQISAGAGNDNVNLISAHVYSARIGLGGGNDMVSGAAADYDQTTIQGGAGNDTIFLASSATESAVIGGDAINGLVGVNDGNDSIVAQGVVTATKIYGGGGNDMLQISAADFGDSGNLISLGAGQDTINISANSVEILSSTIGMGADNDVIQIADDNVTVKSATWKLGAGNDTIKFTTGTTQDIASGSTFFISSTIFGGAGSDLLFDSADGTDGGQLNATFGFKTADSTIAGYDTIAVGGGSRSATYRIHVAGATLAQAQLATADFTASNSVVTFTSTFSQDLTARVESLDANLTSGEVALFSETNSNLQYLFVQGGASDTLVQLGTAQISGGITSATITVSGTTVYANL